MDISFKNKRIEKSLTNGDTLNKEHGEARARRIRLRLAELSAADSLMDLWPPNLPPARCHELTEGRRGNESQLSVDLDHPYRLIFVPGHNPIPRRPDGGLDWGMVTEIKIIGIEDTHGDH